MVCGWKDYGKNYCLFRAVVSGTFYGWPENDLDRSSVKIPSGAGEGDILCR